MAMSAEVMHGDCLDVLPTFAASSADACVTDPPYGLSFMGKHWDHGVPGVAFWVEALRLLKPGARLLAFGGTRTYHRMACAIEDAGFEIEDSLCWLYGSGFPKHKSKLKPAYEPIVMARKPAAKATPLNIDECRLGGPWENRSAGLGSGGHALYGGGIRGIISDPHPSGRWPANVVLGCACDSDAHEPTCAAAMLDAQSGDRPSCMQTERKRCDTPSTFTAGRDGYGYGDTGGASRFFLNVRHTPIIDDITLCDICAKHYIGSAPNARELCETLNADSAESSSETTPATSAVSAPGDAWDSRTERIARDVRSAASLCDSCATCIARALVALKSRRDPASALGPVSISERKRQTLLRSLALYAETWESTDTTPTIASLKLWCGYVRDAIASITNWESGGQNSASGPTRFAYHSKASRSEREAGLGGWELRAAGVGDERRGGSMHERYGDGNGSGKTPHRANNHPCVKPVALMRWLVRLVTPPDGLVLDPFCGSGTTGIAATLEGRRFLGIEREAEYVDIARARIAHAQPALGVA
jgi:DNA modification methylase